MSLLPPVTLPQFVADDAFDFLQAGYRDAVSLDQMPEPLWANATGGSGLSRLDPSEGHTVDSIREMEGIFNAQREDPSVRQPATVTMGMAIEADTTNSDFIAEFGMVQEAMENVRISDLCKGKSKGKGKFRHGGGLPEMPYGLARLAQAQSERSRQRAEALQSVTSATTSSAGDPQQIYGPPDPDMVEDSTQCVICLSDLAVGDIAVRLTCRHLLHSDCYAESARSNTGCPICRTDATILTRFRCAGDDTATE